MRKHYTIGDVSKRLGISRDALRFYEKKGMITPQKLENGYRSYTYEDIRKLLDILYYRRLHFSIEEINQILNKSSYGSYYDLLEEKISEEEYELALHRQSLLLLNSLKRLYKNIERYKGSYEVRPMPRYYQLEEADVTERLNILDLCYIYQEFCISQDRPEQVAEYYLLSADTADLLGLKNELEHRMFSREERCVYTIIASESCLPDNKAIEEAVRWAQNQGYGLTGRVYTGYLLRCTAEGTQWNGKRDRIYGTENPAPTTGQSEPDSKKTASHMENTEQSVYYIELYLPVTYVPAF